MIAIGSTDQVPEGTAREFEISGRRVAVFAIEGSFYALDSRCPHRGGPLAEGLIEGRTVTCPWHGWTFDLQSGQRLNGAPSSIGCYRVLATDGELMIELP